MGGDMVILQQGGALAPRDELLMPTTGLDYRDKHRPDTPGYVLFLGGSETYGRCVRQPFPSLFSRLNGIEVLNLGLPNAGYDTIATDPDIVARARQARLIVLQLMGAHLMTNRFYRVHKRRNDRFLAALPSLKTLYPGVDFSQFSFVGHMLRRLQRADPDSFALLVAGLQQGWRQRLVQMQQLYRRPMVFLWLDHGLGPTDVTLTEAAFTQAGIAGERLLRVGPAPLGRMFLHPEAGGPSVALAPGYHQRIALELAEWLPPLLKTAGPP